MGLFSKLFRGNNSTNIVVDNNSATSNVQSAVIDMSKSAENLNKVLMFIPNQSIKILLNCK